MRTLFVGVSAAILIVAVSPSSASAATPRRLHFRSPAAAMRYLARAYNAGDTGALRHVTNSTARDELEGMRGFAVNLVLDHCTAEPSGMYECLFTHDYPSPSGGAATSGGFAHLRVAPVRRPGWVAKGDVGCG